MARYGSMLLVVVVCLLQGCYSIPSPVPLMSQREHDFMLDDTNESSLRIVLRGSQMKRTIFKTLWVAENGRVLTAKSGDCIEVAATTSVSDIAHQKAATIVARVTRYMYIEMFKKVAAGVKVGIFTAKETLAVYPEYIRLANTPACGKSCAGDCSRTCTPGGRKWGSLAGLGGARAVAVDENVLCTSADGYLRQFNVLVHELAHTIKLYGVGQGYQDWILRAYDNAKENNIWSDVYAMSNVEEYWGVGSGVFFFSDTQIDNQDGWSMNECEYKTVCTSETAARAHLKKRDPTLYKILIWVYTDGRPEKLSNIGTCLE